jgi:hypothetical protein
VTFTRKILLLDSSHGREIGPMLKESLGKDLILSVFLRSLVKILASRIILLKWEGQETAWIKITNIL